VGSELAEDGEGGATALPEPPGRHTDECETIGEFCLLHGWPQRPIDFTAHFESRFNYRMWNDYQWSMGLAPTPISPVIITGI
jgi:hypothetical protein